MDASDPVAPAAERALNGDRRALIRLVDVRKTYDAGKSWAVRGVNLEIEPGELLVLLGQSGCGKTTTLKLINRLIEPSAGCIEVDGHDVARLDAVQLRRGIGYVFQNVGLFPHLTVAENVAIVPRLLRWPREQAAARVAELLELVHLPSDQFAQRSPRQLSGGQRQRVGLARALAARPRIMLMDEPFGALDPLTRDALSGEYRDVHRQLGLTTVMVTHDMTEALVMADRIAVMAGGEIVRLGTPRELLRDPRDEYVRHLTQTPKRLAAAVDALLDDDAASARNEEPAS